MGMSGFPSRLRELLVVAALCLGAVALYAAVAGHLLPAALLGRGPFGADTRTSAHDFLRLKYEWKHPLMSPVEFATTELFRLRLAPAPAVAAAIAALAGANVVIAHFCLRRVGLVPLAAGLGAAVFAVAFSNLAILGVPESYTVSTLATLLFLLAWLGPASDRRLVLLGLLAGLAGLTNVPLLSLAGLPAMAALIEGRFRRAAMAAVTVGSIAAAMVAAAAVCYGLVHQSGAAGYLARSSDYVGGYAMAGRLLSPGRYLDVLSCFLLFGVATPAMNPGGSLTAAAAGSYLGHVSGLLGAAGALAWCGLAAAGLIGPGRRLAVPLLLWLLGLATFYVFFKPIHAMVYGVQAQPAMVVMAGLGAATLLRRPQPIAATLGTILVLVVSCNLPGGSLERLETPRGLGLSIAPAPPT